MLSEPHIYKSAQALIEKYRLRAWSEAITRMERYWLADNADEMHLWRQIANTIHMIQTPGSPAGETIH
jgi:hypothetical protein